MLNDIAHPVASHPTAKFLKQAHRSIEATRTFFRIRLSDFYLTGSPAAGLQKFSDACRINGQLTWFDDFNQRVNGRGNESTRKPA